MIWEGRLPRIIDIMAPDKDALKGDARDQRSGPQSLARREREAVRKIMNAEALEKCHETRAAYVECAKGACRYKTPCGTQAADYLLRVRDSCTQAVHSASRSRAAPSSRTSTRASGSSELSFPSACVTQIAKSLKHAACLHACTCARAYCAPRTRAIASSLSRPNDPCRP